MHPVVGYMGSQGHQEDLDLAVPAIARLLDERPELTFELFGTIRTPSQLLPYGARVRRIEVKASYMEFLISLSRLGWDIGVAPLVDTPFNRCKAPTKFIEYSACGIPVAASNMPVYSEVMPKNSGELVVGDWYGPLCRLLDDPAYRQRAVDIAREHCAAQFAVKTLEHQLASILDRTINERRTHAA
jgi:glycosyltransferase involved in cell wall biosynthesis